MKTKLLYGLFLVSVLGGGALGASPCLYVTGANGAGWWYQPESRILVPQNGQWHVWYCNGSDSRFYDLGVAAASRVPSASGGTTPAWFPSVGAPASSSLPTPAWYRCEYWKRYGGIRPLFCETDEEYDRYEYETQNG